MLSLYTEFCYDPVTSISGITFVFPLFTELVCLLQTAQASFHGTWRHKFSKYEPTFG